MSCARPLFVVWVMSLSVFTLNPGVRAADPVKASGILRAVDAREGTIILKKMTGELLELRAGESAKMTLDGKATGLDALKPGTKVAVSYDPGTGMIFTLKVETEPVRLRISISKEGDCRVIVGRSIPKEPKRPGEALVPITNWYSARAVEARVGVDQRGSFYAKPNDPKKRGGMLVYPAAFRIPLSLTLDIAELRDANLAVQFITPTVNIIVQVKSEDGLSGRAMLKILCSSRAPGSQGAYSVDPLSIERSCPLTLPEEIRFQLPFPAAELGRLCTLCTILGPTSKQEVASGMIRNVTLLANDEKTLGLGLGVKGGKIVVEGVQKGGLASEAGVEVGDFVVAMNGTKLTTPGDQSGLAAMTFGFGMMPELALTLSRGGKERSITIRFD